MLYMSRIQCTHIPGLHFLCVLDNLLTPAECKSLIERANATKTDNKGNKSWHRPGTGGSYARVLMIDTVLAETLYKRIQPFLPTYDGMKLLYLNTHFRFSRYNVGGHFPLHCDGTNYDTDRAPSYGALSAVSMLTLNIFLNDDFVGGETAFYDNPTTLRYTVKPKAGRAALFFANQYHCGNSVGSPYKYLLRTDVMAIKNGGPVGVDPD